MSVLRVRVKRLCFLIGFGGFVVFEGSVYDGMFEFLVFIMVVFIIVFVVMYLVFVSLFLCMIIVDCLGLVCYVVIVGFLVWIGLGVMLVYYGVYGSEGLFGFGFEYIVWICWFVLVVMVVGMMLMIVIVVFLDLGDVFEVEFGWVFVVVCFVVG